MSDKFNNDELINEFIELLKITNTDINNITDVKTTFIKLLTDKSIKNIENLDFINSLKRSCEFDFNLTQRKINKIIFEITKIVHHHFIEDLELNHIFYYPNGDVNFLSYTKDDRYLISTCQSKYGRVILWETNNYMPVYEDEFYHYGVDVSILDYNQELLLTSAFDMFISSFDINTQQKDSVTLNKIEEIFGSERFEISNAILSSCKKYLVCQNDPTPEIGNLMLVTFKIDESKEYIDFILLNYLSVNEKVRCLSLLINQKTNSDLAVFILNNTIYFYNFYENIVVKEVIFKDQLINLSTSRNGDFICVLVRLKDNLYELILYKVCQDNDIALDIYLKLESNNSFNFYFSNDSSSLVITNNSKTKMLDLKSRLFVKEIDIKFDECVALSNSNKYIATSINRTISIYDIETNKKIKYLKQHMNFVNYIAILNENEFVTAGDGELIFWRIDSLSAVSTIDSYEINFTFLFYDKFNNYLICNGYSNQVIVFNLNDKSEIIKIETELNNIDKCLSINEKIIVMGDNKITIYNFDGKKEKELNLFNEEINDIFLDNESSQLLCTGNRGDVLILCSNTFVEIDRKILNKRILNILCNNDYIVYVHKSNEIIVTDKNFNFIRLLTGHNGKITHLKILEKYLITSCENGFIKVWDLETGKYNSFFSNHGLGIDNFDINEQLKVIISVGSYNNEVRLWKF